MKPPPTLVERLLHRWRKRVFPNDNIVQRKSPEGNDVLVITRGKYEATLEIGSNAYEKPNFMVTADSNMRYCLKRIKELETGNG